MTDDRGTIDCVLQPLRVTVGWRIDYNIFTHFDPGPDTAKFFYGEWLFAASHSQDGIGIELRFQPEGDPAGEYVLDCYRIEPASHLEAPRRQLIKTASSKSRQVIVATIEKWMASPPR